MVGVLHIIILLGTIICSSSSPGPGPNPLDVININLNLGELNNGKNDHQPVSDYGYKNKYKKMHRYGKKDESCTDMSDCYRDGNPDCIFKDGKCILNPIDCSVVKCDGAKCDDGNIAPTSPDPEECCPDIKLCPIKFNGTSVQCFPKRCPDGNLAPTGSKTCVPDNPNPGSGSVCCPDAGLCKRPPECNRGVDCGIVMIRCKDGSSPGYMKDACCPSLWMCLDRDL